MIVEVNLNVIWCWVTISSTISVNCTFFGMVDDFWAGQLWKWPDVRVCEHRISAKMCYFLADSSLLVDMGTLARSMLAKSVGPYFCC